jgi:glycosyltransferase involved in cell wall biosynthesis
MISLCMVIRNEQGLLTDCLNDVKNFVEEIVIVDQSSTDESLKIAGQFTHKVFTRPSSDFHETDRQFSIDQASSPWILTLNPDERLDNILKANLNQLIRSGYDAFLFPMKNYADDIHPANGEQDFHLRFFKKGSVSWPQSDDSSPVLHTRSICKINDGFILNIKKEKQIEVSGESLSISGLNHSFDLASHLKRFESQNAEMTDDEARYRLLYELSLS